MNEDLKNSNLNKSTSDTGAAKSGNTFSDQNKTNNTATKKTDAAGEKTEFNTDSFNIEGSDFGEYIPKSEYIKPEDINKSTNTPNPNTSKPSGYEYKPGNNNLNNSLNKNNEPYTYYAENSQNYDNYISEKEAQLRKLNEQLNRNKKRDRKGFKKLLWLLLLLLLIGLLGVSIYYFIKNQSEINKGNEIRISLNVSEAIEGGQTEYSIKNKPIMPSDTFDIDCTIRNSNKFGGDTVSGQTAIYVRYKIELIVDGVAYTNIIKPSFYSTNWHDFRTDEEPEGAVWDGYYYFYGKLNPNVALPLFTALTFDFMNTPNSFGNKRAEIVVIVDAVEALIENIGGGAAWGSAPSAWLINMQNGVNREGQRIDV